MKVIKQNAVALLRALGFTKAGTWDDEKLLTRLQEVPVKVEEDGVPEGEGFTELYEGLTAAVANKETIELDTDEAKEADEVAAKPVSKKVAAKPVAKKADVADAAELRTLSKKELLDLIKEEGLDLRPPGRATTVEIVQMITKARAMATKAPPTKAVPTKVRPGAAPTKTVPTKTVPAKAPPTKAVPEVKKFTYSSPAPRVSTVAKDFLGCRLGTMAAHVNAALKKEWVTEQEISKACGLPMLQTRGRLYYAAVKGQVERRRRIEYRLKPAPGEDVDDLPLFKKASKTGKNS